MSSLLEQPLFDVAAFDEDVPCQGYDETCARPAHWRIIFTCCAEQRNACSECKIEMDNIFTHSYRNHSCQFCGARPAPFKWRPL